MHSLPTRFRQEAGTTPVQVTIASSVVAAILASGLWAAFTTHEEIGRFASRDFFERYFRGVVQEEKRREIWRDKLTGNFRSNISEGFREYSDFWGQVRNVAVEDVRKVGPNDFTLALTFTKKNGEVTGPTKVLYHLTCDLLPDKLPGVDCKPRHLQIDEGEERS